MSNGDGDSDLDLDLDVDTEDYATTAAHDTPTSSARTTPSETDFEAQRASYEAKVDTGDVCELLIKLSVTRW